MAVGAVEKKPMYVYVFVSVCFFVPGMEYSSPALRLKS